MSRVQEGKHPGRLLALVRVSSGDEACPRHHRRAAYDSGALNDSMEEQAGGQGSLQEHPAQDADLSRYIGWGFGAQDDKTKTTRTGMTEG